MPPASDRPQTKLKRKGQAAIRLLAAQPLPRATGAVILLLDGGSIGVDGV